LRLAVQRYGQTLTINGSDEFKEKIARVAAATRLAVRFDNAAIEKQRLLFLAANSQKREHSARRPGNRR
jgi:hypothetical protein